MLNDVGDLRRLVMTTPNTCTRLGLAITFEMLTGMLWEVAARHILRTQFKWAQGTRARYYKAEDQIILQTVVKPLTKMWRTQDTFPTHSTLIIRVICSPMMERGDNIDLNHGWETNLKNTSPPQNLSQYMERQVRLRLLPYFTFKQKPCKRNIKYPFKNNIFHRHRR